MKPNIAKYFWGLNERAVLETEKILKNSSHPKFIERLVTILERCDNPKELFSLISKEEFTRIWPKAKKYWRMVTPASDFRDWWQTIYEQLVYEHKEIKEPRGISILFSKIGRKIRDKRIQKGYSQDELALKVGMRQPDVSKIEEGKKNITLETLTSLCRVLNIKNIEL